MRAYVRCVVVSAIACGVLGVKADQGAFVGTRSGAMGGTGVVSVDDATAQWYNPAAFGFMNQETHVLDNNGLAGNKWGWNLAEVGAGYNMTGEMGHYLDIIADVDFDSISKTSINSEKEVRDLLALASGLNGVSKAGNAFYVDTSVASSMRFGSFGIGVRMFGETAMWVDELDTRNLGLTVSGASVDADLTVAANKALFSSLEYLPSVLSVTQIEDLQLAGLNTNNIYYLDSELKQLIADGTIDRSDVNNAADLLSDIVVNAGGGILESNKTAVAARGFAVAEIPLSYGRAINDNLSVGITAKAMYGRVLGTHVWVFDDDNLDEAYENVSDTESDTLTFGLDLGAMYRMKNFQFGVIGRNLNRPTFDGYSDSVTVNGVAQPFVVADVKLDPQVTFGAAFIPSERLVLEVNVDAFEEGTLLAGYNVQRLKVGGEFDMKLLALRVGAHKNLAEVDEDWVVTAGVGFDLFGLNVDVGGAASLGDNVEVDGNEIPSQARLYAGIGLQF